MYLSGSPFFSSKEEAAKRARLASLYPCVLATDDRLRRSFPNWALEERRLSGTERWTQAMITLQGMQHSKQQDMIILINLVSSILRGGKKTIVALAETFDFNMMNRAVATWGCGPVWKESDVHRTCPVHKAKNGAQTGAQNSVTTLWCTS